MSTQADKYGRSWTGTVGGSTTSWAFGDLAVTLPNAISTSDLLFALDGHGLPDAMFEGGDLGATAGLAREIRKRQKVSGIAEGSWLDPETTYTLSQLKTAVNACTTAVLWVSGAYTGGASEPATLATDYADSASTEAELLTLVLAMRTTKRTTQVANEASAHYYSSGNQDDSTWSAAKALADTAYAQGGSSTAGLCFSRGRWFAGPTFRALLQSEPKQISVAGMPTYYPKTVQYFDYAEASYAGGTFSKHGFSNIPNENEWGCVATSTNVTAATDQTADLFDPTTPPIWCDAPGDGVDTDLGFKLNAPTAPFVLLTWDFTDGAATTTTEYEAYAWAGARAIVRDASNVDTVYQYVEAGYWLDVTPAAAEFPAAPADAESWTDSRIEWLYSQDLALWLGSPASALRRDCGGAFTLKVRVPAAATVVFAPLPDLLPTGEDLTIEVTPEWQSSWWIESFTARWIVFGLGTAPGAIKNLHLSFAKAAAVVDGIDVTPGGS